MHWGSPRGHLEGPGGERQPALVSAPALLSPALESSQFAPKHHWAEPGHPCWTLCEFQTHGIWINSDNELLPWAIKFGRGAVCYAEIENQNNDWNSGTLQVSDLGKGKGRTFKVEENKQNWGGSNGWERILRSLSGLVLTNVWGKERPWKDLYSRQKFHSVLKIVGKHWRDFFKIFIVIQLQLSAFSPHPSTPPQPKPPLSPLILSMCPL